jgi:hypothetical protein
MGNIQGQRPSGGIKHRKEEIILKLILNKYGLMI